MSIDGKIGGRGMTEERERPPARPSEKGLKPYRKPTLSKGPVLSHITADGAVSGLTQG